MSTSSPAFSFDEPVPPIVVSAARSIAATLSSGTAVSRAHITCTLSQCFGGSDAEGRWSVRDAHAALELAQVMDLQAVDAFGLTALAAEADALFAWLEALVPSQANRSEEQIAWQQFATPPRFAWLAARACAFSKGDNVLEPSAGTGMLALWADKAGAILALTEISPLRRDCLAAVFPQSQLTGHDAELIDALPARAAAKSRHEPSRIPMRAPFRLVATAIRPLPAAIKPATAPHAIMPLAYQPLETPAPIEAQVGHYLPYRPSRIVIADAAEHPTPLVESVAMGSIAAPAPHAVPQLPEGLVPKGLLSAAQAETLIYAANAHDRDLPGRYEAEDKGCSLKASAEGQWTCNGFAPVT